MGSTQPNFFHDVGNMSKSTKRSREEDEDELEELRYDCKVT